MTEFFNIATCKEHDVEYLEEIGCYVCALGEDVEN